MQKRQKKCTRKCEERTKLSSYLLNLFDVLVAIGSQSPYFSPYAVARREYWGSGVKSNVHFQIKDP